MTGTPAPLLLLSANQAWNLVNFRGGLIRALAADGFRLMAAVPPDETWVPRLESMGCRVCPWPLDPAGASPWRDGRSLLALRRLVRRHRPAALLSWTIKPNIYGALAARGTATLALPNISGLGTLFIRRTLLTAIGQRLYRIAFARCPVAFFQNPDDAASFANEGLVRPSQIRLLPGSGVDLRRFRVAPRDPDARGRFVLVARLVADKGVREFVAAARLMRDTHPRCRFRLVGPVNVANRTAIPADEVAGWVAEGLVEHLPSQDDIRPTIVAADWIVLPSYREGMSRILLEAAATGRPIVATDVPGCRDIVTDGDNGFLAPARDAAGLAAALRRAADTDDARWNGMAAASRARVERDFSEARVVALYRAALRDAGLVGPAADALSFPAASAIDPAGKAGRRSRAQGA